MIPLWFDFLIKVTIGPKYSPILALVRCFIKKDPVWVGAVQKRFAWGIGLFISTFVAFCLIVLSKIFYTFGGVFSAGYDAYVKNTASFQPLADSIMQVPLSPPILLCILCCIFMWLEAIVGYCVGCKIYGFLVRKKWLKEYPRQNCSDGSCSIN
jgi:uncharacterized membrane protein